MEGNRPAILVSCSDDETQIAQQLVERLKRDGAFVLLNYELGEQDNSFHLFIESRDIFIILWSKTARSNERFQNEINQYPRVDKRFIFCIIDETPPYEEFEKFTIINFKDFEIGYLDLATALDLKIKTPPKQKSKKQPAPKRKTRSAESPEDFTQKTTFQEGGDNFQTAKFDNVQPEAPTQQFESEVTTPEPASVKAETSGPEVKISDNVEQEGEHKDEKPKPSSITPFLGDYRPFAINEDIDGVIGVKELAAEIACLLRNLKVQEKGKMVGIFGNWGRGKTFLMKQICSKLIQMDDNRFTVPRFYIVDFHAWKHQDTPASWAYLFEAIAKKYYQADEWQPFDRFFVKHYRKLRLNFSRLGIWPFISLLLIIAVYVFMREDLFTNFKVQLELFKHGIDGLFGFSIIGLFISIYGQFKSKAINLFHQYFKKTSFKELLGIQAEIQRKLRDLLTAWISDREAEDEHKRVLLVVDDIDRCSEDRLIQIIDSLRVMLEDEKISNRVVVLTAVDENVLKRAIKWKYHPLLETDYELKQSADKKLDVAIKLTREYMDKLFLSAIKLGTLTRNERIEIFQEFVKDKVDSESSEEKVPPEKNSEGTSKASIDEKSSQVSPTEREKMVETPEENSETTEEKSTVINIMNDYEISFAELKELKSLLNRYRNATPRQIRIFYYRYLLARNLLANRLDKLEIKRSSEEDNQHSLLGELLLKYSCDETPDKIKDEKLKIFQSEDSKIDYKLFGKPYTEEKQTLYEVFSVLEMVVAY